MRITKWMIAVALAVSLFSARPLAADGAATVFDVVILHGPVKDPETNLDAVRNVGIFGRKDTRDFGNGAARERNDRSARIGHRAGIH